MRAREGSFFMAEELGLEQPLRDRGAVTLTNGPSRRIDAAWRARATRSLPTPLSPLIRTVVSVSAMLSMTERIGTHPRVTVEEGKAIDEVLRTLLHQRPLR